MNNVRKEDLDAKPFEELLSALLRHPDIPEMLEDAIRESLTEMYNRGDQSWLKVYESSPEYIAAVIQSCTHRDVEWPGQLTLVG